MLVIYTYLPKEKLIPASKEADSASDASVVSDTSDPLFKALLSEHIDIKKGLFYCQQDEVTYRSVLSEYALESAGKREKLDHFFADKDWGNYSILIHSLKSSSKMIGAMSLSKLAEQLEHASDAKDSSFIEKEHAHTMEMYAHLATVISTHSSDVEDGIVFEDIDGVLEFAPTINPD